MGNYIQKSLEEGEHIIYNGRLHWSAVFKYFFGAALLALLALVAVVLAVFRDTGHARLLTTTALVLLVLAIAVWAVGCVVRTRTEFAVTNTRFVQKDGIFNIKMTEIPLVRIETVNFYQSMWQHFIGTGCVELVGSGGTSHQVHCIEQPMKVRKVVCATIKGSQPNQYDQGSLNTPRTPNTPKNYEYQD